MIIPRKRYFIDCNYYIFAIDESQYTCLGYKDGFTYFKKPIKSEEDINDCKRFIANSQEISELDFKLLLYSNISTFVKSIPCNHVIKLNADTQYWHIELKDGDICAKNAQIYNFLENMLQKICF